MTTESLRILAEVSGIGGVALGVILLVFREIIRRNDPAKLGKANTFKLLKIMVIAVWSVGLCGIAAWTLQTALKPAGGTSQEANVTGDNNKTTQTATTVAADNKDTSLRQKLTTDGNGNTVVQERIGAKP